MGLPEVILLDTHVAIWLALEPERLSPKASTAIRRARQEEGGLAISAMTLFELAQLVACKRVVFDRRLESVLAEVESRLTVLPITAQVALLTTQLPSGYPGDPMDRIIGATALAARLELVTADERIQLSKAIVTIW
jgi:PIN domain nuclease of toxin-antitoxin system